eukprot:CAMPEP_0170062948 /NCGR_PEP_ID=MMETSP0019_2-20121128/3989_1 /TAXON_ID=98059 /ORGANISM="Dinobryon sp., Strain UTEXLB2267" /LENGTH=281 /DNA_ID=CAMNT_0010269235 /DNA_START=305 /DNA_END=1150 /DNA_ORIENTATION=-
MSCGNTKQQLERAGINALAICTAPYKNSTNEIVNCNCPFSEHRDEAAPGGRAFVPVNTVKLRVPFPPVLLLKKKRSIRGTIRGSIHASSIISSSDEDTRDDLKLWFGSALALPSYFQLPEPPVSALQADFSREFLHYKRNIEALGVGVWDIQETSGDMVSVLLEDSNGAQKRLSGRADFIISSRKATCREAASPYALCVVKKQSKPNEEDCEYQLLTYLFLMMNRYGFPYLAGILLCNDGTCRAYRAIRDSIADSVYESNSKFQLYQIADVLPGLLRGVDD